MKKEKTKVYIYTRVSTAMQVDGYSLDAQKNRMKAFCDYNDYEIAGEYEDAGKSGKSTLDRVSFNCMIRKMPRQNGKKELFTAELIRKILQNPVYCGKIAYGRRKTEKIHGTRNEYHMVKQEEYLLYEGIHEALVSEDTWERAQIKILSQAKKYEKVSKPKDEKIHLLSGIVVCPICGSGMYGNKVIKRTKDGSWEKVLCFYGCKHRQLTRGDKCNYRKQINEALLDGAVSEVLRKLVSNKRFAEMMKQKINTEVDTSQIDQDISVFEKQLRQAYNTKEDIIRDMDSLDYDDKHYSRRKKDLEERIYRIYDKIDEMEDMIAAAKAKKRAILTDKITSDNIYKALVHFDKLYDKMNEAEKREFVTSLISKIHVFEERQPNGQWLKSIEFKLPIINQDMELRLDNDDIVETVVCLSNKNRNS